MRSGWMLGALLCLATACAARVAPQAEDPAADGGDEATVEATVEATWQALQLGSPIAVEEPPIVAIPEGSLEPAAGKNKCTPERQESCDHCAAGCESLCDEPNGGGQSGGCVGLFCPTRCDTCVLGCYKACGKCLPSFY